MRDLVIQIDESNFRGYAQYLTDESRKKGSAVSISFPENSGEVKSVLERMGKEGVPVTVQGARTGLSGGAVPHGGHIMSCIKLGFIGGLSEAGGGYVLPVGAGVTVADIEERLRREKKKLFWPAAPTEPAATAGGALAGTARGIYAARYGEAADWTEYVEKDGGVIVSAGLRLMPAPESIWGVAFFFPGAEEAAGFILEAEAKLGRYLAALELLDGVSLACISELRRNAARLKSLPETAWRAAMAYVEIHSESEALSEETAAALMDIAERQGSDPDSSWALSGMEETGRVRIVCHAAQEAVLAAHDARLGGEALGLDLTVKGADGAEMVRGYKKELEAAGVESAVFGSLTGGRLRICPLPRNEGGRKAACALLAEWRGGP